jgi:hypothetical protein
MRDLLAGTHLRLGRGGPFLGLLRRLKLKRDGGEEVARVIFLTLAAVWLPFVLLEIVSREPVPLRADLAVHTRLLVSVPLLYWADVVLHDLCALAIEDFTERRVAGGEQRERLPGMLAHAERLRSSALAEIVCLGLALFGGQASLWGQPAPPAALHGHSVIAAARTLWPSCIALPVFIFLLLRALWRWLIWCWLLWRFSQVRARLVPSHPDGAGGLAMLAIPGRAFAIMLAAVGAAVAGTWSTKIAFYGADLRSFAAPLGLLVAIALAVGVGPLLAFSGQLVSARLVGLARYGHLAHDYTTKFDDRWIVRAREEDLLGNADIQSLADLANSFRIVHDMRVVIFEWRDLLILLGGLLVPIGPLVLTVVPLDALLKTLAKAVF